MLVQNSHMNAVYHNEEIQLANKSETKLRMEVYEFRTKKHWTESSFFFTDFFLFFYQLYFLVMTQYNTTVWTNFNYIFI